jgi:NAD(P)-dependent dehydrogenase (short-subunit alcohol dehydrogenase family)
MQISFDNRVAIVTGAGRGIGREYALALARRGAKIVVNDIGPGEKPGSSRAHDVVGEILAAGGAAVASTHDITTVTGGQAITDLAVEHFGTVDIVINNAGILRRAMFEDADLNDVRATIDVHLIAPFNVTQPAWKVMKAKGYGRVVMTSSAAGFGMEGNSSYAAAKASLLGLVSCLALEGDGHGIKVNAVLPFAVSLMAVENPALAIPARDAAANVGFQRDVAHRSPASAVAAATLYLASAECAISGDAISALAGRYARTFRVINQGWLRETVEDLGPEDVRDHIAEIVDIRGASEIRTMTEEFRDVRNRVFGLEGKPV